jgi:hypothetical protein
MEKATIFMNSADTRKQLQQSEFCQQQMRLHVNMQTRLLGDWDLSWIQPCSRLQISTKCTAQHIQHNYLTTSKVYSKSNYTHKTQMQFCL